VQRALRKDAQCRLKLLRHGKKQGTLVQLAKEQCLGDLEKIEHLIED